MRKSRANKGQFFVIAALLVSVILVGGVISTYSLVRNSTVTDSPEVLGAIGEMNSGIKSILDFTVGYYGSILQVTGNSSYAQGLTSTYLSSGLVNIARSHPELNPSFTVASDADISTSWFMPESSSKGELSVTYSLGALGIEGINYETSSALTVNTLVSASGQAQISVLRDDSEPELGLTVDNFWFYNYSYADSKWELVNPTSILISSNGVYTMPLPTGVGPDSYSVQIEDNRGIVVSAFYSQASVESDSHIPHYSYTFDWESTGVSDIYDSLSTDNFVIELLQNGTLKWLGQPLEIDSTQPIPPVSVKAFRVNATINDISYQVPFQVEDWASDYMVPLGLSSNDTIFCDTNMLVFMVNNSVSEITLWWDGNDTATPSPYAWQNNFGGDVSNTYNINLSNGNINLNVQIAGGSLLVSSSAGYTSSNAEFLRINGEKPTFGAGTSVVIADASVRTILQQEPEYSGGATNCPNVYAQIYFTLPLNTNYYTYTSRLLFVDSNPTLGRILTNLNVVEIDASAGNALTENGTSSGYPVSDGSAGSYYDQSPSTHDHHWSEFISGSSGTGVMFRDVDVNLYNFDSIIGSDTGAISVEQTEYYPITRSIEVNPVDLDSVDFDNSLDTVWTGAVVTFNGEPIHPTAGNIGLWVMVENPPAVSMAEEVSSPSEPTLDFFIDQLSDEDSSPDKGSHSDFSAQQAGPDSSVDVLTEATETSGSIEDYVDNNTSDVDTSEDVGSHSNFPAQQAGPDSIFDTLTEENTAESGDTTLLDDGFEDYWGWDVNWDDISHDWERDSSYWGEVHSGSYSARASNYYHEGVFASDNLDASDATAIHVDFWFRKYYTGSDAFTLYYYNGTHYNFIAELDTLDGDNQWIPFTATITDSQYFVSNFRIQFDATLGNNQYAWVDDVVITKEVSTGDNYELDLEVQFTDVVDLLSTHELCIYTGDLGSEDLIVEYRSGSSWESVATDLNANSWNNFTISVSSPTVTVRFSGGSETGDASADQWQIDTVLLSSHGSGSVEEVVDNVTSDVDSFSDLGNLADFSNMGTVDSTYATLTESGSGGGITFVASSEASTSYSESSSAQINKPSGTQENDFMMALLVSTISGDNDGCTMSNAPAGWTPQSDYTQYAYSGQHVYVYWKIAGSSESSNYEWTWAQSCAWAAQITTFRGVDTNSPINVEGTVNQENDNSPRSPSITTTADNCMVWLYDMCDGTAIPDYGSGGAPYGTSWIDLIETSVGGNGVGISTAYYAQPSAGATGNKDWSLSSSEENSAQQIAFNPASSDCRLDQEVQWTDVPYMLPNEQLAIYGGALGSENIAVDVWNGAAWVNVFTDLSSGWNNASISEWLTESTFTIRFRDTTETGDSIPDAWQIDAALIHVWNEGGEINYELDLEVQWTNVDYSETNEELCIYVGEVASENLMVDVWTGSGWDNLFARLNVGWNNATVSSYLTSEEFTIRFVGSSETGDATQDYWTIDATLLHTWS